MESVGIMASKDVDMDDTPDLEYDELALGPSKRRRMGLDNFSFTSSSLNFELNATPQHPSICSCNSDDTEEDKSRATTTLHFQCLVPAAKMRDCQGSPDKSHSSRLHSICHRYEPEVQVGPMCGTRNPIVGFPTPVDRDKYKKWVCKNDLYEFRTSKYNQTTRSISFLDRLRAAKAASACTSSQCPGT